MSVIQTTNHGPLILSTNYWDSELATSGKLFVSVNAGAIRVLLPPSMYAVLTDMRTSKECVLSRGAWPQEHAAEGIEIMWDDGSDSPFALHLTAASFDLLPAEPESGHWRRVATIPYLQPWE